MTIFAGSIEVQMLCWAMALGLVQLVVATTMATLQQGLPYNMSPRDLPPPPVGMMTAQSWPPIRLWTMRPCRGRNSP